MNRGIFLLPVLCLGVLFLGPAAGEAFAEWQTGDGSFTLRGYTGLGAGYSHTPPGAAVLSGSRDDLFWALDQRLLASAEQGENSRFALNLLQNFRAVPDYPPGAGQAGVERSGLLMWRQHASGNSEASLTVDTVAFHFTGQNIELSLGRQPVNLATTFYFSPNDFFAPFAVQTFYRTYKPGVDSVRAEVRLADLAQLSLVGVLGYAPESIADQDWRDRPDWSRNSFLVRLAVNRYQWEWGLLAGSVRNQRITGGSLQGELFAGLAVRAEGHYAAPEQEGGPGGTEVSVGLEHRFVNSLELRLEQFHHGQGYGGVVEALAAGRLGQGGYTGRDYTALGASYEFSPLFTGQALLICNWSDHSRLLSLNGVYSLADDAELAVTLSIPLGEKGENGIASEFGLTATTFLAVFRFYY